MRACARVCLLVVGQTDGQVEVWLCGQADERLGGGLLGDGCARLPGARPRRDRFHKLTGMRGRKKLVADAAGFYLMKHVDDM